MKPVAAARTGALVAAVLLIASGARSHEVAVEQIVRVEMRAEADRLVVRMQIPETALTDARLPRLPDGTLDPAAIDPVLPIVAADVVRNLDVQQDGSPLRSADAAARVGADRTSVDVDATYPIDGAAGLSARLNAFRGGPLQPVRTTVNYARGSGAPQTISIAGPPARVTFDPALPDSAQEFLARALAAALTFGDHLLMLACLLVPARTRRGAARVITTLIIAQAAGMVVFALGSDVLAPALPAAGMIAASLIVMAAVQNIVLARDRFVTVLVSGFGLLNGLAFGRIFTGEAQFAGAHRLAAFAVFVVVFALAESWLGAIAAATRTWLAGRGAPDRILTPLASALIAHSAVHHVIDRGHEIAQGGSFAAEHALLALAVGWAIVMVLVAAGEALREGRLPREPDRIPGSTGR
ncbi:MAG TPA: hypothetical protein VKE51_42990 [Vicinamibacterales bacterium]|nr:hypothetical protein [Vicinamibacterales bacterium]